MKIKSVKIEGLHQVTSKEYYFKNVTYLVGKNGSGKSTVLQAIQLGLLGYIPGYAKNNQGVFKHAKGKTLSVTLKLDDDGSEVEITRCWIGGSTVKSSVDISPAGYDLQSIISKLELPIFNFNEFLGMSANAMKDWFIEFLPKESGKIDWKAELGSAAQGITMLDPDLLNDTLAQIDSTSSSGIAQVREVNSILKEKQSFLKGRVASLQGTLDSLVHYDDIDCTLDEGAAQKSLQDLHSLLADVSAWDAKKETAERAERRLQEFDDLQESYSSDTEVHRLEKLCIDLGEEECVYSAEEDDIRAKMLGIKSSIAEIQGDLEQYRKLSASSGRCPYTSCECSSATAQVEKAKQAIEEGEGRIREFSASLNELANELNNASQRRSSVQKSKADAVQALSSYKSRYAERDVLKAALSDIGDRPSQYTIEEIRNQIDKLTLDLQKCAANARYEELSEKVAAEKFVLESSLDIVKAWIRHTDANGMQTVIMNSAFLKLGEDMSKYLSTMFNKQVTAKFNLSEKSNSFSFGLIRDDKYITFDTLSSGEKCLYTLALMICLTDVSGCKLKLVMVDDLLDHLDDENATYLFNTLSKINNVQIITAGVKPCECKDVTLEISSE